MPNPIRKMVRGLPDDIAGHIERHLIDVKNILRDVFGINGFFANKCFFNAQTIVWAAGYDKFRQRFPNDVLPPEIAIKYVEGMIVTGTKEMMLGDGHGWVEVHRKSDPSKVWMIEPSFPANSEAVYYPIQKWNVEDVDGRGFCHSPLNRKLFPFWGSEGGFHGSYGWPHGPEGLFGKHNLEKLSKVDGIPLSAEDVAAQGQTYTLWKEGDDSADDEFVTEVFDQLSCLGFSTELAA